MKSLLLYILLLSVAVCACTGDRSNASFQNIEAFMGADPDSALALATAFEPHGKAEHARRALLIAKAADKAYHLLPDDSLIRIAADFYHGHNDSLEVQSLYYLANQHYNDKAHDKALLTLHDAENLAQRINDYFYVGMSQQLQALIHSELFFWDKEIEFNLKSIENFTKACKPQHVLWAKLITANSLKNAFRNDSAIQLLNDIIYDISHSTIDAKSEWHRVMALVQNNKQNYHQAVDNFTWILENAPYDMDFHSWAFLCDSYINLKDIEKSQFALQNARAHQSTPVDSIFVESLEYDLDEIRTGNHSRNIRNKQIQIKINKERDFRLTHPYYSLLNDYLNNQIVSQKKDIEAERKQHIYTSCILALTILLLAAAVLLIYNKNKIKESNIRMLMQNIAILNNDINEAEQKEEYLNIEISSLLSDKLTLLNKICTELYQKPSGTADSILVKRLESIIAEINSPATIAQLEKTANTRSGGIITKLQDICPKLNDTKYRLAIYIILGFSTETQCFLLHKSINNLYVIKHRLRKDIEESESPDSTTIIEALSLKKKQ